MDTKILTLIITRTYLFSPFVLNFPIDDVQYTKDYSSTATNSSNHGSILVHAYTVQENQRSIYPL